MIGLYNECERERVQKRERKRVELTYQSDKFMIMSYLNFHSTPFKVFRALANILELLNYSMTFYIYCLFSEDFRNTLLRTMKWPWFGDKSNVKRNNDVSIHTFDAFKKIYCQMECDQRMINAES